MSLESVKQNRDNEEHTASTVCFVWAAIFFVLAIILPIVTEEWLLFIYSILIGVVFLVIGNHFRNHQKREEELDRRFDNYNED